MRKVSGVPRLREQERAGVALTGAATMKPNFSRRRIIRVTTALVAAQASGIAIPPAVAQSGPMGRQNADQNDQMPDVTPPEDLMREHGVLNRVLLIYEATMRKFADNESFDASVITQAAQIVRDFVEDYHERNEEQQIFPRFQQAGQLVALCDVLYQQHQAGRRLTETILKLAPQSGKPGDDRQSLIGTMRQFIAMYRPHEAREDTVLFPKLRSVVSADVFDSMADDFEKDEHRKFGQDGFAMMVDRVARLERSLGIYDLAKFTPR
jgi:hemerythrin-like domain-containing protein